MLFDLLQEKQNKNNNDVKESIFNKVLRNINPDLRYDFGMKDYTKEYNILKKRTICLVKNNNNNNDNNNQPKIKKQKTIKSKPQNDRNKFKCKCKKSKCLQYYCECFTNNSFCKDCQCKNCFNTETNENERNKAILLLSIKNKGNARNHDRSLMQGCKCSKSHCQKKYCECYNKAIVCTLKCKCTECKNNEQNESISIISKQLNAKNYTNHKREREYQLSKQNNSKINSKKKFLIDRNISNMFNQMIINNDKTNPSQLSTNT